MSKRDIIERLLDPMIEVGYGDRLMAADEIERLRAALQRDILADSKTTKNAPRYYSVDGYPLRDGLRAALGEHG
jgi:hypothetical protein